MSTGELSKEIAVTIPTDTRVISISVTDTDAQRACDIANTVRQVAAEKLKLSQKLMT